MNIPKGLEGLDNIGHFKNRKKYYIYFLCFKERVRYIGRTTQHPMARIGGHRDKHFTDIFFIEVKKSQHKEMEQNFIFKFKPFYNNNGHCRKAKYRPKNTKALSV